MMNSTITIGTWYFHLGIKFTVNYTNHKLLIRKHMATAPDHMAGDDDLFEIIDLTGLHSHCALDLWVQEEFDHESVDDDSADRQRYRDDSKDENDR